MNHSSLRPMEKPPDRGRVLGGAAFRISALNDVMPDDCRLAPGMKNQVTTYEYHANRPFSGMAFRWMSGPGRFGLSDAFGDAAEDAIRQLYDSLARTELVPGQQRR